MSKLLIDTNVLVYSKDTASSFHKASFKIIFNKAFSLFVTSKNLSEYYSVVTKGAEPLLSPSEALNDMTEIISYCNILFPNELSQQKLIELIQTHQPKGLRIHDFEIASIALANGITQIATFNKVDFQPIEEIKVIEPTA